MEATANTPKYKENAVVEVSRLFSSVEQTLGDSAVMSHRLCAEILGKVKRSELLGNRTKQEHSISRRELLGTTAVVMYVLSSEKIGATQLRSRNNMYLVKALGSNKKWAIFSENELELAPITNVNFVQI